MQYVFDEVNSLDKRCYDEFNLSEDILMEHAAFSIASYIQKKFKQKKSILIVCGVGNNGADGLALARLLYLKHSIKIYLPFGTKSHMSRLQLSRVKSLGLEFVETIQTSDIIVDCLFGSGLNKALNTQSLEIIEELNSLDAFKIACDIPSGIDVDGYIENCAFNSDITITMGAYKTALFSDQAKEYVGKIKVSNLGIQREVYETSSSTFLLEKKDLKLPFRTKKNTHKGTYGHMAVIVGEKEGAGIISALAGFSFGAGLVSIISHEKHSLPHFLMQSHKIPNNCTSIALGMGLGKYENKELQEILNNKIKKVIDADLFYEEILCEYLNQDIVLTPHPKEFCSLLKVCGVENTDVKTLQSNRMKYVKLFCNKYPMVTLLLKGANTIIANNEKCYINPLGQAILSKGGSGDVLSGLIASLLAQGYENIDACISASLAHSIAGRNFKGNDYALTPLNLIKEIKKL